MIHAGTSQSAGMAALKTPTFVRPGVNTKLGQILLDMGLVTQEGLSTALHRQRASAVPLGHILRTFDATSEDAVLSALSAQFDAKIVDIVAHPPDPELMQHHAAETCLRLGFVPWRRAGNATIYVTSDPAAFHRHFATIPLGDTTIVMSLARETAITDYVQSQFQSYLSQKANDLCPVDVSCRRWARPVRMASLILICATLLVGAGLMPTLAISLLFLWIAITLSAMSLLRLVALIVQARARLRPKAPKGNITSIAPLPTVSLLVPLHKEAAVLPQLLKNITALDYPKELLDVLLVLESTDEITKTAVDLITLPHWMRVVIVPPSKLQTKPRAMNYALDLCKGSVVGIYDAEDAPEPDQIRRIVDLFALSGPDVACIQGYLDFYNPSENWLARCFTIEYAIWFRVVLHGIEKLGLPVPLGGTTVFFRREALERLGGWDAYNVTEDADLGFRLARKGYRCAFLSTTTFEEANCHTKPWIKQRSRWLKGYAATWITHMQNPITLFRELGFRRFLAFQVLLLGTISNFLVAPFLWVMWVIAFGVTLPFMSLLPDIAWMALGGLFMISEATLFLTGLFAVSGPKHRHLMPWVAAMMFYWPLGSLAAFKALYELLRVPFYWDKTQHTAPRRAS